MTVRGAVAEKHLEKYLNQLLNRGQITGFRTASSDFDKDFVIVALSGRGAIPKRGSANFAYFREICDRYPDKLIPTTGLLICS